MPFLPLLLDARGLSGGQIAHVMFVVPVLNVVVPSLWGVAADALRARVLLLRIAAFGCGLSMALLLFDWGYTGCFLAVFCICFFRASIAPLVDAAANSMLGGDRSRFSRIRLWGSLGFGMGVGVGGFLDVSHHPERLVMLSSTLCLVSLGLAMGMKATPIQHQPRVLQRTFEFVAGSKLPLLLLGSMLYYAGHSLFDTYFSLYMRSVGYSDAFVGVAWSIGVFSEVLMMFFAPRILAAWDPRRLILLSSCIAIARWVIIASTVDRAVILASQPLHAFTFGLWYISLVKFVQDETPEELRTSMQSMLLSALGVGSMFGTLAGGHLLEAEGGRTLFLAAAVAATCATACYVRVAAARVRVV